MRSSIENRFNLSVTMKGYCLMWFQDSYGRKIIKKGEEYDYRKG
jgi:hypothetical protein